jgi:beta-xylosidase
MTFINGKFYITAVTRWTYDPAAKVWPRAFWISSADLKHWSDPVWGDPWGIDPELFQDPATKKVYLNIMAPNNNVDRLWGISQCQVNLDSGRCIGQYRSIWNGTLPHTSDARPEGPKMFKRGRWYYLLIAEGMYALRRYTIVGIFLITQVAPMSCTEQASPVPQQQKAHGRRTPTIR